MRSALCLTLAWVLLADGPRRGRAQEDDRGGDQDDGAPCFSEEPPCLVCTGDNGPVDAEAARSIAGLDGSLRNVPFCHTQDYICGEFGCMSAGSSEGKCLTPPSGRAQAGCIPTSDCQADPNRPQGADPDDMRGYPTCNGMRCYVPNMSPGATADNLRSVHCTDPETYDDMAGEIYAALSGLFTLLVTVLAINGVRTSIYQVSQREVIIIERFGKYNKTLTAGLNFVVPYIDRPKTYSYKYILTDGDGMIQVKQKTNECKISTQEEVLDFPKQRAISRDNAIIELDAVLNFKILHPKVFIYSCVNLPLILSKLLQAQLRNVAGSLELDQMIQDAAQLNVL